jgi:bacillithiol system protein YtxJ
LFFKRQTPESSFNWKTLSTSSFDQMRDQGRSFVVFKHSIRCYTSSWVKKEFEKLHAESEKDLFLVSVIEERPLSNHISTQTGVRHESPQILIFENGECIAHDSHSHILDITF